MKILLVNPSRFFSGTWGSSAELSHLLVLYSHLRTRCPQVEVEVLDLERELGTPATEAEIGEFLRLARAALEAVGFDVIGISCWTSLQYLSTLAVAQLAKELFPECRVVVGGYHPSACPEDFEYPGSPVDDVVVGEGEIALERIVTGQLRARTSPQRIPGQPADLGAQTLLWDEYKYYRTATTVPIWISRGCPFSCSFCLDRLSRWRALDPGQALAEIQRIVRQVPRATSVDFMDPIFGLSRPWRREFLDLLIDADLPLHFWGETRADLLEEEDIARLGALDFQMDVGLDAVAPRMIEIMRKARNPDKYLEAFRRTDDAMSRHGVPHQIYLIVNYPGETLETLRATWSFCREHRRSRESSLGTFSAQPFKYFPGNEIHRNRRHYEERYGTRVLHPEWWKMREGPYHVLSARIVASRELADADAVFEPFRIVREINALSGRSLKPGQGSAVAARRTDTAERLLMDPNLELCREVYAHETGRGTLRLFHFATGARYLCDERESGWIRRLQEGQPADRRDPEQLAFCRAMVAAGMLRVRVRPPAEPASGAFGPVSGAARPCPPPVFSDRRS